MKYFSIFFFLISLNSFSQTGGENAFAFLNLPFNARTAALGNDFITSKDEDLNLTLQNPSLYNSAMHNHVGFNQALLSSGINYGMLSYAKKIDDNITGGLNFRYVTYGVMDRRNEAGVLEGQFYAGDFIIGSGFAKQLNPLISVGANLNLIYSQMESQASFGASLDLAGTYELKEKEFLITALVKNAGYQLKPYGNSSRAPLPTEFQLAVAKKVKHAPFRFSLLMHHLNKFDLTYTNPNIKPTVDILTGDTIPVKVAGFGEKLMRHFTYQVELIFSKNFHIRTAFDYHLRQEMKVAQKPGIAGFSFGVGLKFKRFNFDYGIVTYSSAGFNHQVSLTANIDKWRK